MKILKKFNFIHLHLHTKYSLLDGAIRFENLFQKALEYCMPAVAITDHGNLFGIIDFYQFASLSGIKPIIGCELYITAKSRFDKISSDSSRDKPYHLIVLAYNFEGYKNLIKLSTISYLEGFYYKPRIDKEILRKYSKGLIGLSACLQGQIANLILNQKQEEAIIIAKEYKEIFGPNNFYLEIMENGIPEQKIVNKELLNISKKIDIPLVATNDCHYLNKSDAEAHEILLCIQTGKTMEDPNRMRLSSNEFYFKTPQEMYENFDYCPEAIKNSIIIAEKCNLKLDFNQIFLPTYKIQTNISLEKCLIDKANFGLQSFFKKKNLLNSTIQNNNLCQIYEKRLKKELQIISSMGFAGYFLIVADFVNYAKLHKIPVGPGRGSGAGSLVAYLIGITTIDPIHYNLFFERFLNPERKSMPDFDIDFCIEGREEIIRYVTQKYGEENVAQIITFGSLQAKGAIRDVGRAMNMSYGEVDKIAKLIPNITNISINEALKIEPKLREQEKKNDKIKKLLELSKFLEGLNRHSSTHAAGVVISDVPLIERIPLCRGSNGDIITQYSMNDLQKIGLIKFDFLGLRTLTVIRNTIRFIKQIHNIDINIDQISLKDKQTYQLLGKGNTDGIFQLESAGMKDILINLKPDCIEDIIALIALYRPGPIKSGMVQEFIARKQGKTEITYELPQLEMILKETYGIILYQEQVMQIAVVLAQYSMGQADSLRKAMSKKDILEMKKAKPKFLAGTKKNQISDIKAKKIFEQMETFAGYGFNKSHSTAYAILSYQTAYLKTHYPIEFMTSLLTSEKNNRDKIIKYITECRDMKIGILPPDINESLSYFTISGNYIRFGLAAIKNIGLGTVEEIISIRKSNGKFKSFIDFIKRVNRRKVNKRVIESLIKCGSFDSFKKTRKELMKNYEIIINILSKKKSESILKKINLIENQYLDNINENYPNLIDEWNNDELLAKEKEILGFYITGHPLDHLKEKLTQITTVNTETIISKSDAEFITIAGIITEIRPTLTRRKETMAYAILEDIKGSVVIILFKDIYKKYLNLLKRDEPLIIKGKIDMGENKVKIIATEILSIYNCIKDPFGSVHFKINSSVDLNVIELLKEFLNKNKGKSNCYIHLINNEFCTETIIFLGKSARVNITPIFQKEANQIIGIEQTIIEI